MTQSSSSRHAPEQAELEKKVAELGRLQAELVQRELDLATLGAELDDLERRYLRVVGARYAELDDIEARIAEALARLRPRDSEMQENATRARCQARESAEASKTLEVQEQPGRFKATDDLRRLYREVAKAIHPDLANSDGERARRTKLMAEANRAYREGDVARLEGILREWAFSPEAVLGDGPGAEWVRTIRKIAQIEGRLRTIEAELAQLKGSDLYQLKIRVDDAELQGRDLLAEMAEQLDKDIADAERRFANVQAAGVPT